MRKTLGYPPFGVMIRIVIRGPQQPLVATTAAELGSAIGELAERGGVAIRLLGPAEAPFAKLRGNHRYAIQVQAAEHQAACPIVEAAAEAVKLPKGIRISIDVDPLDMM